MQIHTEAHWVPKRGNAPEEYEDAFWPPSVQTDAEAFRCAVADGATEASFSREWARRLAAAFGDGVLRRESFLEDVANLQAEWQQEYGEKAPGLSWYAEQKAEKGAYASLLGLVVHAAEGPDAPSRWEAIAVGDSNVFQVRAGQLLAAFPLQRAEQFTSSPYLVSTNAGSASPDLLRHLSFVEGEVQPGDSFYLMTDALACWFLGCCERGEQPWERLDALPASVDAGQMFGEFVSALRDAGELQNDDVTLVRLCVDGQMLTAHAAAVPATRELVPVAPLWAPKGDPVKQSDPVEAPTPAAAEDGAEPVDSEQPTEPVELGELEELTEEELDSWIRMAPEQPVDLPAPDDAVEPDLDEELFDDPQGDEQDGERPLD